MRVMGNALLDGLFLPSIPSISSIPFVPSILSRALLPHNAQPDAEAHGEVVDVFAEEVPRLEAVVVACLGGLTTGVASANPCVGNKVLIAVLIAERAEQSTHAYGRAEGRFGVGVVVVRVDYLGAEVEAHKGLALVISRHEELVAIA